MAREPFSSDEELAKQGEQERKQRVLDYKALFGGERGARILADLDRLFGYTKPSAQPGMRNEEVWLREGMKMPMRHIHAALETTFRKTANKPKRALAAHHHEDTAPPPA
jgi:hypothetical protein